MNTILSNMYNMNKAAFKTATECNCLIMFNFQSSRFIYFNALFLMFWKL